MPRCAVWLSLVTAFAGCGESIVDVVSVVNLDRGLVVHLAFDEAEPGATAVDSSGHGHDGKPSSNPPLPSASVPAVGFADPFSLAFNGTDQLIDLGNDDLQLEGALTLCAWVNATALDGHRDIVAHGNHSMPNQEVALRIRDAQYEILTWDGSDHVATAPVPAADVGTWVHLCGVYEGGSYLLYRNGILIAAQADPVAPGPVEASWGIGARSPDTAGGGAARFFAGALDDIRIYARALSAEEVRTLATR